MRSSPPNARSAEVDQDRLTPAGITWREVEDWDRRYYIHPFRTLSEYRPMPVERAEGSWLYLADGRRILDFMSQYICTTLGQGHPKMSQAIAEAAMRYTHLAEPWISDYRSRAAKLIIEDLLGREGWAGQLRFVSTGSEAIEMALIMAKLFTGRANILTQEFSYHGWTQGAAGATGLRSSRGNISTEQLGGGVREVPGYPPPGYHLVPAPSSERNPRTGRLRCIEETEHVIRRLGPETIAAFVCDVALAAAAIYPPPDYIPEIREMTQRFGILWVDDEIINGFGRLGKWFGYQLYDDIAPDILVIAKGLVASAVPAAAVVVRKDIGEFFGRHRWWLPTTFGSHPLALAAIVANIELMIEEDIVARVAEMGDYVGHELQEIADRHRCVSGIAGAGLLWFVELVQNRQTGKLFVPEDRYSMGDGDMSEWPTQVVSRTCLANDVFITGFVPNTLRLGPPLTITRQECDHGLHALDLALTELDERCEEGAI